jgi:hypothetical protein
MLVINRKSVLWNYLTEEIQDLITDGEALLIDAPNLKEKISDYSYLVFPFAKAYEGFLKKLFLDLGLLKEDEYYGDDIRIGKILNPSYIHELTSVYKKIQPNRNNKDIAQRLWTAWRKGRNQVFHYFPHNFRKLSYDESMDLIKELVASMDEAVQICKVTIA